MTANVGFAGQAQGAPGAMISRGPGRPPWPRRPRRQWNATLIVIALAAAARLARDRHAREHVIMFVIVLAAAARLARDSQARTFARVAAWDKRQRRRA
jgi:hypothetical protein